MMNITVKKAGSVDLEFRGVGEVIALVAEGRIRVTVNPEAVRVMVDGEQYAQYLIGQFTNPLKPDDRPARKPRKTTAEIIIKRDPKGGKKRVELNAIETFWSAMYENFRNISKQFWR